MRDTFLAQVLLRIVVACARDVGECTKCSDGNQHESNGARVVLLRLGRVAPWEKAVKACNTDRLCRQCVA